MTIHQSAFETELATTQAHRARVSENAYLGLPKRVFDVVVSLILLPAFLLVITLLYIPTRLDGGPGFFGHSRIGKDGRMFRCWKLRTMVPDAEARLKQYLDDNPEAAREWSETFKLRHDPRVTRLGGILRATSLDELPQIWNVLVGDMSLVGPRPVTVKELEDYYGDKVGAYKALRPGVTGVWQVSGRNGVSYEGRVRMDAEYGATASLWGDIRIILKTAVVMLRKTGI
jgi:lipopolysaccharide/colanic/teichoic acid biosynthesis glycosyltransferase